MTGYRSSFFRHVCQDRGCYIESLPNWDEYIECFPRGIRPTDVDGFVEINGHLLFLEEKQPGKGPDEGQRRALAALAVRDDVTVVYLRPKDAGLEVLVLGTGEPKGWQPVTRAQFKDWLRWWCTQAERAPA